jgi:hypothetical protein
MTGESIHLVQKLRSTTDKISSHQQNVETAKERGEWAAIRASDVAWMAENGAGQQVSHPRPSNLPSSLSFSTTDNPLVTTYHKGCSWSLKGQGLGRHITGRTEITSIDPKDRP